MELIIDNFAGGGGASTGIFAALGRHPDIAINHDAEAVAMHAANHPTTEHYCQNIWQANPGDVCQGRPVGLAWFSPDCKHFSKAKGGKPVEKRIRDLAWVVVAWAKQVRPRVIILENVEEFQTWGPLLENGKPCPERAGFEFKRWVKEIRRLGYKVEWRELRACDYGAPTIRKRLFLIARCDGLPITWPAPTHGDPKSEAVTTGHLKPWRTAAEIIDWTLPCPSIFLTRDEAKKLRRETGIACNRPLAEATMARIARGLKRFVIDAAEPFIVTANHGGDWFRGNDLKDPLMTLTAARDAHGLVVPYTVECANASNGAVARDIDKPVQTITATPKGGHVAVVAPYTVPRYGERPGQAPRAGSVQEPMPVVVPTGNGASLVSAFLAKHFGGMTGVDIRTPFPTLTARGTQNQVVTSHLMKLRGTCKDGQGVDKPIPTLTSGGTHVAEVRAFLMKYYGTGGQLAAADDPLHTASAKARFGLVMVSGVLHQIVDIGMRMLCAREMFRAQGFPEDYKIDIEVNGKPLSKTAQTRLCGNSVCPDLAEALVRSNYAEGHVAMPTEPDPHWGPLAMEAAHG